MHWITRAPTKNDETKNLPLSFPTRISAPKLLIGFRFIFIKLFFFSILSRFFPHLMLFFAILMLRSIHIFIFLFNLFLFWFFSSKFYRSSSILLFSSDFFFNFLLHSRSDPDQIIIIIIGIEFPCHYICFVYLFGVFLTLRTKAK